MNEIDRLKAALGVLAKAECSDMHRATIGGLICGYHARWEKAVWTTVAIEEEFLVPIVNPETGHASRTFAHGGRVDGIVRWNDQEYLLEHKTTSEDISDPHSPYWRRLQIDAQINGYMLAHWQMGRRFAGVLYDVIRKPAIRPRALTRADLADIRNGKYHGVTLSEAEADVGDGGQESFALFQIRLMQDTLERPDWYFQREPVQRLDVELAEYAQDLHDTARDIADARRTNRHYRNPSACQTYGSYCEYLPLCSSHDEPESDNWRRRDRPTSELYQDSKLEVLSYSRMACFRTCRRQHYYRYEMQIERDKERAESLAFGALMHEVLAAWWRPQPVETVS